MIKPFKNKFILLLLIMITAVSCMQEEYEFDKLSDEAELEIGLLGPMAYGSLGFDDLMSSFDTLANIDTDEEGLYYFAYEDTLTSLAANDIVDIPAQDFFEYFYESDEDVPDYVDWGDSIVVNRTERFPFVFSHSESLDSVVLEAANLNIDVSSSFQHEGRVDIICTTISRDGDHFETSFEISDPSGTYTETEVFPLDGYTIELTDSTGTDTTYLDVNFRLVLYNSGNGISSGDEVAIISNLTDIDFEAIYGYVGNYELMGFQGDLDLGFFSNTLDGTIQFADPQITFNVENSFGLPAEMDISYFKGYSASSDDSVGLNLNAEVNPFRIDYPEIDQVGERIETSVDIDKSNSTVDDFISSFPERIVYNVKANSNPDGPDGVYNFVLDTSEISFGFELLLPLWLSASNFAMEDTIEFDFSSLSEQAEMIEQMTLYLEVLNGLPVEIDFQVFFLDESYNVVDQLFAEEDRPVVQGGEVNSEFYVETPGESNSEVVFTNAQIKDLESVRYASIYAGLNTVDYESGLMVKFYDYYKIQFSMSVDVDAKVNTNKL